MRPEDKEDDYIEDKENEEIEDINSDTQDNETTEEEANTHSDYKVPGKGDTRVTTYHLSGMYQNWFQDHIRSVVWDVPKLVPRLRFLCDLGTGRSAYQRWTETRTTTYPALHEKVG